MADVKEIIELIGSPNKKDTALITKAYNFSEKAHEGQKRMTGDPYFVHAFETGKNLATFGMDSCTIAAGLLHDTIEDAEIPPETLEKEFGKEVLFLVEGVTKLGKLKYRGVERHVESLRKLFIATASDVRVLIIKLADRLHNVQTLHGHTKPEKQKRIALETLEIFAPLANRLGMWKLKSELEDGAFPFVYPEEYKKVKELLKQRSKIDKKYLEKTHRSLQKELAKQDIQGNVIQTGHRVKSLYSLYQKLLKHDMDMDQIYDIIALRVIVQNVEDCYRVLGIIHGAWTPLPGRVKDYIATAKPNGYKSLHTTIFTGNGGIVEVQIRTEEMHKEAEYGIASHIGYKEGVLGKIKKRKSKKSGTSLNKKLGWIQQLIEWQKNVSESGEYLENIKMDFFGDRVFVFTPDGDVIDLPEGSTPIDFAYAVHSDIGDHVSGAEINGKFVSLNTKLEDGVIVEIQTKKGSHPSPKWLDYAKTTLALRHIRAILQKK
jgi:GTP pyrophosphokinase